MCFTTNCSPVRPNLCLTQRTYLRRVLQHILTSIILRVYVNRFMSNSDLYLILGIMASRPTAGVQSTPSESTTMTRLTSQEKKEEMPGSPAPSITCSMHSSSENSDTSTLKYDQESYDLFRPRVENLCRVLWPPQKSIIQSLSNSNIATRLRANEFLRLFIPAQEAPLIERLRGGDYNRIVGITLPLTKIGATRNRDLIVRVPRWGQGQTERVVATLDYLHQSSNIPIPNVIAKDFSSNNPLGSPYVIQNRIPGIDLELLWTELKHSQQCTIARELGRVIKCLLALESPVTGIIEGFFKKNEIAGSPTIVPFELKNADGDLFEEPGQHSPSIMGAPRHSQTILDFFKCQIGRWRETDVARNAGMVDRTVSLWDSMVKVVEEMNDLGLFETGNHCLCHVDLQPRNIMAEINPDGSIQITGILDWDEAVVAPKFVNCKPPGWLWGFDPDDRPPEDLLTWPYEVAGANDVPSTSEKQELKRIFEEHAGLEYFSLAYDEPCRMSRGLFRVAVFGLTSSENYSAAERIISEWARLRQCMTR